MRSSPREQLPAGERPPRVPLATLIGRELRRSSENAGEPRVRYGHAGLAKRGEDYFLINRRCQRALAGSFSSTFSVFAVIPQIVLRLLFSSLFPSSPVPIIHAGGRRLPPPGL